MPQYLWGHDVLAEGSNFYFFDRGHCKRDDIGPPEKRH